MKFKRLLPAVISGLALMACGRTARLSDLRVEYLDSPVSVSTTTPRFTWTFSGRDRNFCESSFTVNVYQGGQLVWSSGKVEGSGRSYMSAEALPLYSNTDYEWEVESTGKDGRIYVSDRKHFSTAILDGDPWLADWISDGRPFDTEESPILRKTFNLRDGISSAKISFSACAYADVFINGRRITETALNPGYTHYDRRNLYVTLDVAPYLKAGPNVIVAVLGNGFYDCIDKVAVWEFENARWKDRPKFIASLSVRYSDGAEAFIGTDASWEVPPTYECSPYKQNNIYSGDHYDNRLSLSGLNEPDFDARLWVPARVVGAPSDLLTSQYMGLNDIDKVYPSKSVTALSDTLYIVDFGYNSSGFTEFEIEGAEGTTVTVQHGEVVGPGGRLTVKHMDEHFRPREGHSFQTDCYVLKEGHNTLRPSFNYHGFQYAEIISDSPIKVKSARSLFIHTSMDPASTFESSDPMLGRIREIVNRAYLSNHMGIPTDCPQREKNGWTADAHISAEIGLLGFDSANAYLKWIDDIVDNQEDDGRITGIIPSSGWGFGIGPVWDAALFVIPEMVYNYYGDKRAVKKVASACEKYLAWLDTQASPEGLITYGLGDWVPYDTTTPNDYTSSCYYYYEWKTLARFQQLCGEAEKAAESASKADSIKQKINSKYFNQETSEYSNGSQCAQSLALYMGIAPEGRAQDVADVLAARVEARGGHLDFGMIGTKTVLRMLCKYGYCDLAYRMAVKKDAPSWAEWVERGFTTAPEHWTDTSSLNHVFFGDIAAWLISDLAGINCDPENPGFGHIIIRPCFPEDLDFAKATYDSVAGPVMSSWKRRGGKTILKLDIPPGSSATVYALGKVFEVPSGKSRYVLR